MLRVEFEASSRWIAASRIERINWDTDCSSVLNSRCRVRPDMWCAAAAASWHSAGSARLALM